MNLFNESSPQSALTFPVALTEKFRPRSLDQFVGLDKPKKICARLASQPFASAWLFVGPSGTGKTTMALALAELMPAELTHIPSQQCTLERIKSVCDSCEYMPMSGCKFRIVLIDEADAMSNAAQLALLSKLDGTAPPPNTIFIFTCNSTERFESRFMSRTRVVEFSNYGISKDASTMLETVWASEAPSDAKAPNFARIVKEANGNIRESLMVLETELMLAA